MKTGVWFPGRMTDEVAKVAQSLLASVGASVGDGAFYQKVVVNLKGQQISFSIGHRNPLEDSHAETNEHIFGLFLTDDDLYVWACDAADALPNLIRHVATHDVVDTAEFDGSVTATVMDPVSDFKSSRLLRLFNGTRGRPRDSR